MGPGKGEEIWKNDPPCIYINTELQVLSFQLLYTTIYRDSNLQRKVATIIIIHLQN